MNHDEAEKLLGLYQDGELDMITCLELEKHLAECSSCQKKMAEENELVSFIQADAPRFKPSPFLRTRIQATLREEAGSSREVPWWQYFSPTWGYFSFAVVLMILLLSGFFWMPKTSELAQEAVANHVRSLQVSHLVDIASTDQHTVKPWFAGKLDYSPQVIDLAASGYPLIGGRLDVLNHRTVAAIVYQRHKHYINLFIWPSDGKSLPNGNLLNGYHVRGWAKAGLNYLAVSELGEKEFQEFIGMIQNQTIDSQQGP